MDERQKSISMGQAINITADLILRNEFMAARNKQFSAQELSAQLKASVPHVYAEIVSMQESISRVNKAVPTPTPAPQKPEFVFD